MGDSSYRSLHLRIGSVRGRRDVLPYFGDVSINVAHLLTRYAGWQYQQPHPRRPLGSRYFENVRLLQQDLSTLIRRYLEIVELKDLNLRTKEKGINKVKREDSICVSILVICRRCGVRPRPSSLDCREPRGPFRRDLDFSSTADHVF